MKTLVYILFGLVISVVAVPFDENDLTKVHGENGWYIPHVDGKVTWMSVEDFEAISDKEEPEELGLFSGVSYYLYTSKNPTTPQKIAANAKSILASNFNASNPTRITIHGWMSTYKSTVNRVSKQAWLSLGDYNIIAVNWKRAMLIDYISARLAVPGVGKKVAAMVDYLHQNHSMSLSTLQVIGHSLGAHVAGFTGKNVKSGQIDTIVGCDPALPLFSYNKPTQRLNSSDAFYVESIQTDGGWLGFLKPIGRGAFYPNGGKKQPGCGLDLFGACAHKRSVTYYGESVTDNNFAAIPCPKYQDAVKKDCGTTYSSTNRMGAIANAYMIGGNFYVPVKKSAPYGTLPIA